MCVSVALADPSRRVVLLLLQWPGSALYPLTCPLSLQVPHNRLIIIRIASYALHKQSCHQTNWAVRTVFMAKLYSMLCKYLTSM